jgi:hypothetical protein
LQSSYGIGLFGYLFALLYVLRNWRIKNTGAAPAEIIGVDAAGNP